MKHSKKQFSIRKRLFILFSIIVVPVILIGIFLQIRVTSSFRSNILTALSSRINSQMSDFNQSFEDSVTLGSYLLSDIDIQRIANPNDPMNTYDRVSRVNSMRKSLYNIKISNTNINNVRVYFPKLGTFYNADYAYDYDENRRLGSKQTLDDTMLEELLALQYSDQKMHTRNSELFFLFRSSSDSDVLVEISYAIPTLEKAFSNTLVYSDSYYYFSLDSHKTEITNLPDQFQLPEFSQQTSGEFFEAVIDNCNYHVFYIYLSELDGYYLQLIPDDILFMTMDFSTKYCILFTCIVLFCSLCFILFSFRIIHSPIKELSTGLHCVQNSNFSFRLELPKASDFQYVYDAFNHMVEQLHHLIQQKLQYEILLNRAQLKQLQAQINPHFLYNSFFMLNQMITRKMLEEASELSHELGSYFNYITRNYTDEVSLYNEYEHTRMYTNIQSKRFMGRIEIRMQDLPHPFHTLSTPKLILQPIIENAFSYGMDLKIRNGLIAITFLPSDDSITILIEDNGDNLSDEKIYQLQNQLDSLSLQTLQIETTGLLNICKRLQLYYKKNDVMHVSRSPLGGMKVAVTLYKLL